MNGVPVVLACLLGGVAFAWATGGAVLVHGWLTAPDAEDER